MGGSINVAFRFHDGEACCFNTWTGSVGALFNASVLDGDESSVREYITNLPPARLSMSGYGLILFDFLSRTIIVANSFTDGFSVYSFLLRKDRYRNLIKDSLARGRKVYGCDDDGNKTEIASWSDDLIDSQMILSVDMSGWQYHSSMGETTQDKRQVWEIIKDIGFPTNRKQGLNKNYKEMIIGLTGSIAMGKSTVAAMFRDHGIAVWDADVETHTSYQESSILAFIERHAPESIGSSGIDRKVLGQTLYDDDILRHEFEELVKEYLDHSLDLFLNQRAGEMVILDVPWLFESDMEDCCDVTITVWCSDEEQERRALSRPSMTKERLDKIRSLQLKTSSKIGLSTHNIDTGQSLEKVKSIVIDIIARNQ
jgi:dephospho-CoA kinase